MIQLDDELGQIDFTAKIYQLAEHALNPNLARRALQFDSTNQLTQKYLLDSLYLSFITFNYENPNL